MDKGNPNDMFCDSETAAITITSSTLTLNVRMYADAALYNPHSKSRGWVTEVNIDKTNPLCLSIGKRGEGPGSTKYVVLTFKNMTI
jgi:hypothetical protein